MRFMYRIHKTYDVSCLMMLLELTRCPGYVTLQ